MILFLSILSCLSVIDNYKNKSGCGCVGHGRGFYVNTSALAANIFFRM